MLKNDALGCFCTFSSNSCSFQQVLARRHIDILTARAWLSGTRELEDKVWGGYSLVLVLNVTVILKKTNKNKGIVVAR